MKLVKITDEKHEEISKIAKSERRTKQTVMDMALEEYFKKKGKKNEIIRG